MHKESLRTKEGECKIRKLKIYLAGAMSGLTYEEYTTWRIILASRLKSINESLRSNIDLDIVDPTRYFNFKEKRHESELEAMKFDLHHVKSSDLIIVNFNKPVSQGTTAELAIAYDHDIPIIGLNKDGFTLHPWDENFCDRIFDDMTEMTNYIQDFYLT